MYIKHNLTLSNTASSTSSQQCFSQGCLQPFLFFGLRSSSYDELTAAAARLEELSGGGVPQDESSAGGAL